MSFPETPAGVRSGVFDSDRKAWLAERHKGIGASSAAIVLGVHKFGSAIELYQSKVTPPALDDDGPELLKWGHVFEEPIIREYAERNDIEYRMEGELIWSKKYPHCFATLDAADISGQWPTAIECKMTTLGHRFPASHTEDELPTEIQVQMQMQMLCTGWQMNTCVWLPFPERVLGNRSLRAHEEFQQMAAESVEDFWVRHVEARNPPAPDGSESAARAIKKLYPDSSSVEARELTEENEARAEEMTELKLEAKELDARIEKIKQELQVALAESDTGTFPSGRKVTYKTTHPKPSECKSCGHKTERYPYRVLRVGKAKR